MLNGIDPIIIFQLKKNTITNDQFQALSAEELDDFVSTFNFPPIPIYLSEKITGLYIESEDKSIEIQTTTETVATGEEVEVYQKGIASTVRVNLVASKESIGLTLISALADQVFKKVTSKEYSITYLHGAVTVFNGLLNSFNIQQNAENTLYTISLELSSTTGANTQAKSPIPVVEAVTGAVPL